MIMNRRLRTNRSVQLFHFSRKSPLGSILSLDCAGRMFKFLKGVVAGAGAGLKDLPYNIGEPYSSAWGSWVHYRGTSKCTRLAHLRSSANDGHLVAGRNGVKRLRTVRHPNILSFLHSTEAESLDGSTTKLTIYIVTEPVMPLSEKIKELGLEGSQR
ncbi:hypothetical protein SASPL_120746 [Salvia splendens]|uniref:Protein kinase domain-containing protein n=1 Tax=Salvia splendens TaxID=180675 RepID=A0A8X8ZVH2_SALSN|nr:hypothetical protein SASPL_120746 [Salvia splendens]